jgi:hypothetical protein
LKKKQELDAAYEAANQDLDRVETIRDWDALNDVNDLINNDEDWDWLRNSSRNRYRSDRPSSPCRPFFPPCVDWVDDLDQESGIILGTAVEDDKLTQSFEP